MDEVEALKELELKIDEYEKSIGLTIPRKDPNILNDYLELSGGELMKLTWQQLAEICLDVSGLLVYLQREYNKHKMRTQWCTNTIEHIVGEQIKNYKGFTYKEKFVEAVAHMDVTRRLHTIQQRELAVMENAAYLVQRIEKWLEYVSDLKFAKRKAEYEK